jgi:hypothetical protein
VQNGGAGNEAEDEGIHPSSLRMPGWSMVAPASDLQVAPAGAPGTEVEPPECEDQ